MSLCLAGLVELSCGRGRLLERLGLILWRLDTYRMGSITPGLSAFSRVGYLEKRFFTHVKVSV